MDQPKIERLLRLMKLLTANTTYSVDQLAERLSMSRRTIYRYVETFREAGFVVKKQGDCIRLDRTSPHFKEISQLVHFTEEEAVILKRSIENIDNTNLLKENLKRKLYTLYEGLPLAQSVVRGKHGANVNRLIEAIESGRSVILRGYQSANSSVVRDRYLEPFAFTTGYVQVWCYDREDGQNKLFKSARIESVELADEWRHRQLHKKGFIDIFRMTSGKRTKISLELGILSYNLLLEEYPLSEQHITPLGDDRWRLDVEVAGFVGVGRFVAGLIEDIEIISPPEFKKHLNERFSKIISSVSQLDTE
ncbi:MAG: WYL domain-containing protein [Rikenellaceae bacterium]